MKPLIVITGPTASGKTEMSIEMAQKIGGEIINADSMQVYKYMDIGTAKPPLEERQGIPHYLIDEVEPTVSYSVAQYVDAARDYIAYVHEKQKIPILVGGTGLYIDSVVNNIQYGEGGVDEEYRSYLKKIAEEMGNEHIHRMLQEIDPESAEKIHLSDRKRIIRALEVYHLTGETITEQKKKSRLQQSPYQVEMYAINMDRDKLYDRINRRVDMMINKGLVEEVERLVAMGVNESMTSMQGIGYKEIMKYLKGEVSLDEAVDMIKKGTRHYAKRQLTWFRKNPKIKWIWR